MGANAQTAVPAFTAGQVLTAQQQTEINTGIPVFASTTTRDAAFGGTGEKVLAEGQMAYVENLSGVAQLQYYDGSAWQSLVAPALVKITGETSFSAAGSFALDNVFTSTYRNYKLVMNYTTTSGQVIIRVRAGGSSVLTNTYNYQQFYGDNAAVTAARQTGATWMLASPNTAGFNGSFELNIYNPQIATPTTFSSFSTYGNGAYTAPVSWTCTGNQTNSTAYDGCEVIVTAGTMTGNYTLYGLTI